MKVGLNLLLWAGTITEEHVPVIEKLAELGYDGVELPIFGYDPAGCEKLRRHLDRLRLGCTLTTCVPPEANPIAEEPEIRKAAVRYMKNVVEIAGILGSPIVAGPFTAPVGQLVGRRRTEGEWKRAVEVMQQAAAEAEKAGIKLALEALNRFETYFINTIADAVKFAREVASPAFGIMFDTFHANIEEEDFQSAVKQGGSHIIHVHVSENHRGTPGSGHVPFDRVFGALKSIGYDNWLTIEAFGGSVPEVAAATCIWRDIFRDNFELAEQGLRFVRETWSRAG